MGISPENINVNPRKPLRATVRVHRPEMAPRRRLSSLGDGVGRPEVELYMVRPVDEHAYLILSCLAVSSCLAVRVRRGLFFSGFAKFRFCPGLRALSVLGLLRDAARRRMPGVHDAAALRAAAAIARSRTAGASRTVAYITAPTVAYTISVCWLAAKSHRRAASPIAHRLSKREGREEAPVAQVGRYPYVA